jgi:hypothetical protein
MKLTFITYSSGQPYTNYANELINQIKEYFDEIIHYNTEDIAGFKNENSKLWSYGKGDGFWSWKPYIIKKTLDDNKDISNGDHIIVYCDTRYIVTGDITKPIRIFFENKNEVLFILKNHHFSSYSRQNELMWSKGDAFKLIGVDMNNMYDIDQAWSGFLCIRNCDYTNSVIGQWLDYCKDERIISDIPNTLQENSNIFRENRYDQTVLSLVLKKNNFIINENNEITSVFSGIPHSSLIYRVPGT